jgi:hypothetical protein
VRAKSESQRTSPEIRRADQECRRDREQRRDDDAGEHPHRGAEQRAFDFVLRHSGAERPPGSPKAAEGRVEPLALEADIAKAVFGLRLGPLQKTRRRGLAHPALVVERPRDDPAVAVVERERGSLRDRILLQEGEPRPVLDPDIEDVDDLFVSRDRDGDVRRVARRLARHLETADHRRVRSNDFGDRRRARNQRLAGMQQLLNHGHSIGQQDAHDLPP